MKFLRRLYFKIFAHYILLERVFVSYAEADKLIRDNHGKTEPEQWVIDADREDGNHIYGMVHICRRERILN